jgi:hypothetical protein
MIIDGHLTITSDEALDIMEQCRENFEGIVVFIRSCIEGI